MIASEAGDDIRMQHMYAGRSVKERRLGQLPFPPSFEIWEWSPKASLLPPLDFTEAKGPRGQRMSAVHSCAVLFLLLILVGINANQCSIFMDDCRITFELKVPNVSCAMGVRPGEQRCWRCCGQGAQVAWSSLGEALSVRRFRWLDEHVSWYVCSAFHFFPVLHAWCLIESFTSKLCFPFWILYREISVNMP